MRSLSSTLTLAAGGIVWRDGPHGPEIATVRRRRHGGDCSLPKGKLDPGETLEECALREVREEVGVTARLEAFAGVLTYPAPERPKVVFFWHMAAGESAATPDPSEIIEVVWLTPARALDELTYPLERELVRTATADRGERQSI